VYPPIFVTACCDPKHGKAYEDVIEHPNLTKSIACLPHIHDAGALGSVVALLSAKVCVESTANRAALPRAHSTEWKATMHHEFNSFVGNGKGELVDPPERRAVVKIMWVNKIKSDTRGEVSRDKARFVAKSCSHSLASIILLQYI
jgi:hypothetical protein